MKITKQRLKEIIREELGRYSAPDDDADDWRERKIEAAVDEGDADARSGVGRAVGYKSFQRYYDRAYDRAMKEKESTLKLPPVTADTIKRMRQGIKRAQSPRSPGDFRKTSDRFNKE